MPQNKFAKSYQSASVETSSPGKVILMLFDGALRFMEAAQKGFDEEDIVKRNEAIHNNLTKAQNIILELQTSLDLEKGGDFAKTMYGLYGYMHQELSQANVKKDKAPIENVVNHLNEIRNAWEEMLGNTQTQHKANRASFSSNA